jgi:hypothetical protein
MQLYEFPTGGFGSSLPSMTGTRIHHDGAVSLHNEDVGVNELSPAELKRLCDVDCRHSMAFVATVNKNGQETQIGASRYAEYPDDGAGELAITVADAWQHKPRSI